MIQRTLEIFRGNERLLTAYDGAVSRENTHSVVSLLDGWEAVELSPVELRRKTGSYLLQLNNEEKDIAIEVWVSKDSPEYNAGRRLDYVANLGADIRLRRTYASTTGIRVEELTAVLTVVELTEYDNDTHISLRARCYEPLKKGVR